MVSIDDRASKFLRNSFDYSAKNVKIDFKS